MKSGTMIPIGKTINYLFFFTFCSILLAMLFGCNNETETSNKATINNEMNCCDSVSEYSIGKITYIEKYNKSKLISIIKKDSNKRVIEYKDYSYTGPKSERSLSNHIRFNASNEIIKDSSSYVFVTELEDYFLFTMNFNNRTDTGSIILDDFGNDFKGFKNSEYRDTINFSSLNIIVNKKTYHKKNKIIRALILPLFKVDSDSGVNYYRIIHHLEMKLKYH